MKNSATTFLIFIASPVRAYEYPRIEGFVHSTEFKDILDASGKPLGERYVYLGRELTLEEFNDAAAKVFAPTFAGEERNFQPLAINPEVVAEFKAKRDADAAAAQAARDKAFADLVAAGEAQETASTDAARAAAEKEVEDREIARKSREAVLAATKRLDAENAAEQKRVAAEEAKAIAAPVARPKAPVADGSALEFTLDGKNIMHAGERVGGLFGDDRQLRVTAAHSNLRPQIEAWLQSQLQPA